MIIYFDILRSVRNGKLDLKEKGDDVVMRKRERRNRGAEVKLEERTTKYLLSSSFVTGLNHRDQLKVFNILQELICRFEIMKKR